jgi:hypothetical protein
MLVSDIINLAAKSMFLDVDDYDNQVMIRYINDAIDYITDGLTSVNDPEIINQMTITGTITKPTNFVGFIPQKASYPLIATGNTISLANGAPSSVTFKYSSSKTHVSAITDSIPLTDYYSGIIISYVCIHTQNDFEANVTQDMELLDRVLQARLKAKGG